ncbi:hypothetical protein MPLDJ20_130075 [Mesorhizobium plurifarium]|uniref:Uncharacterized protein n=1 Tax=Mesorhizobium plurifarium TaxID=69974 RepID=A0A090EJ13_MESPL|nr:hypothetical protein MPLDJ20_130075 [Mesorhizobium plurifarium]
MVFTVVAECAAFTWCDLSRDRIASGGHKPGMQPMRSSRRNSGQGLGLAGDFRGDEGRGDLDKNLDLPPNPGKVLKQTETAPPPDPIMRRPERPIAKKGE